LTTVRRLSTEWFISFDVILFTTNRFYVNLIHFTNGKDDKQHGDRVPAVFQIRGTSILHIVLSVGDNPNYSFDTEELSLNVTHHLQLDQTYYGNSVYRFNVHLDGQHILSQNSSNGRQFYNIQVWTSSPWSRTPTDNNLIISNLTFVNFL